MHATGVGKCVKPAGKGSKQGWMEANSEKNT